MLLSEHQAVKDIVENIRKSGSSNQSTPSSSNVSTPIKSELNFSDISAPPSPEDSKDEQTNEKITH